MNKTKLKLLYLMDLFNQSSNEFNPLSMTAILEHLDEKGIKAERKAIYEDIKTLQDWGMDLLFTRTPTQGYYLVNGAFDSTEIKILVDMISSAEFIGFKKSKEIIQKCLNLTNRFSAQSISNQIRLTPNKKENNHVFYSINTLQEAIAQKRKVTFQYFDFSLKNEKKYRKNATDYSFFPLTLIFENQRYYCIGYSEKYDNFSHYRIDKMDHVKLQEVFLLNKPFSVKSYVQSNFKLTLGDIENVTIQFNNGVSSIVQDAFGSELFLIKKEDETFTINLSTSLSPTFISWILQFGSKAKVLKPQKLIDMILSLTSEIQKEYQASSKSSGGR